MVDYKFYNNKRVLIIGDTGFKGSWLAYLLKFLGAEVFGYALPPVSDTDHFNLLSLENEIVHENGNILDIKHLNDYFNKVKPEIVFHLAAQALVKFSYDEPKLTFDTNIGGSVNILEVLRKCDSVKSFIYVTSDKCYKNNEWIWGYRENDELGGHDPYSASKAAAELVFSSYMDSFFYKRDNIGLGSVRAGNVIGGGDWALDRIIPDCIKAISIETPIIIRNPYSTRPWQHVLEPLSGYLLLAKKMYNEPKIYSGAWNFGPNTNSIKTVNDLAEKVIEIFGKGKIEIQSESNSNHEASVLHLNCDKSNSKLEWFPTWNFDETVTRTANWYKGYVNGEPPANLTKLDINKFMEANT